MRLLPTLVTLLWCATVLFKLLLEEQLRLARLRGVPPREDGQGGWYVTIVYPLRRDTNVYASPYRVPRSCLCLCNVRYGRAAGRIRSDLPGEEPVRSVRREAERVGIAYPTPAGLTVAQFELLLSPLRAPEYVFSDIVPLLIYSSPCRAAATLMASLSTDATVSLLIAAHELGRGAVVHVAKARLCSLWDDRRLPMAESYQTAILGSIARHTPPP